MTTFFFRRSVEKSFQLEEQPSDLSLDHRKPVTSQAPHITSSVDDVMFIVDQMVERSLATSQKSVISSVVPTIARVLGSDFIGMIQRKMRDENYPKAAVQGALPPEETTIAFLVLINNLDVATEYVRRIVQSRIGTSQDSGSVHDKDTKTSRSISNLFPLDHDATAVTSTLQSLQSSFEGKAIELIGDGIFVVFKNIIKPRLRPVLADTFRDVDYQLTQDELEELQLQAEADDGNGFSIENAVLEHFQRGWDLLTKPVARLLTDRNLSRLLLLMVQYLGEVLEKRVWSYYGRIDSLGALRLERDIGSIVSIVVRGGRYGLRDYFTRCTQICLVMNMEDDEWEELKVESADADKNAIDWKLNADERSRARAMIRDQK